MATADHMDFLASHAASNSTLLIPGTQRPVVGLLSSEEGELSH